MPNCSLRSIQKLAGLESFQQSRLSRCSVNIQFQESLSQFYKGGLSNAFVHLAEANTMGSRCHNISRVVQLCSRYNNNLNTKRYISTSTTKLNFNDDVMNTTTTVTTSSSKDNNGDKQDMTYAVVVITPISVLGTGKSKNSNVKLYTKQLSIQQIVEEIPGTHARDFFSLKLTSLGDASRKRRAMMTHYSVRNNIHPWFILPRESEIVVSDHVAAKHYCCFEFEHKMCAYRPSFI